MRHAWTVLAAGVVLTSAAGRAAAQLISGSNAAETARFAQVTRAIAGGGFANVALVGHGEAELDGWFLAYATRSDSGVLLVAVEPELRPLVLERAKAAADIGLNGYRLFPFLGMKDVYDVEVLHHPFMLETTQTFSTHHVVRRTGLVLEQVCEFRGDSRAESSKGIGPRESFETVTIRFVYGQPQEFDVLTGTGASNDGRHGLLGSKPTVRYRIPESGGCVRVP